MGEGGRVSGEGGRVSGERVVGREGKWGAGGREGKWGEGRVVGRVSGGGW